MENICDWKNCKEKGEFRAPIEKDNSKKFRLLCKNHIKKFNQDWDYFKGMNQDEIENFIRSDSTWHRPTQTFGSSDNFFNILWNNALNDGFSFLGNYKKSSLENKNLNVIDLAALRTLELKESSDWTFIQKRFKSLVKKYHPDMNAGSKQYEEKLKKITLAYTHLKKLFVFEKNGKFK